MEAQNHYSRPIVLGQPTPEQYRRIYGRCMPHCELTHNAQGECPTWRPGEGQ